MFQQKKKDLSHPWYNHISSFINPPCNSIKIIILFPSYNIWLKESLGWNFQGCYQCHPQNKFTPFKIIHYNRFYFIGSRRSRSAPARSDSGELKKSPSSKAWVDTRQIQKIKEEPFEIKSYNMDDVERLGRRRLDEMQVSTMERHTADWKICECAMGM